jgi:predicted protein tyrosine phosphatase
MEKVHLAKLRARFRNRIHGKKIVCLDIPDNYAFMDPALVQLLELRVAPHLG